MTLSELLEDDLVHLKMKCASKDELISALLEQVYRSERKPPFSEKDVMNKIQMREEIGGTLLPSGLSAPHARLKGYDGFIIAIGTPAEIISQENIQIKMMALMISSQSGGPYYLPTLASLAKLSRDGEYFSRLCKAESREVFFDILGERDAEFA